jgi:phospholipid/cholesterol/gamma-HCH transport system substrate-binding protein
MRRIISTRLLGVAFVGLLVFAVWLVYAVFAHKFSSYDKVVVHTSTAGLQLPERADVKVRGVLVGELLDAQAEGTGARLTLGISPGKIKGIPANVSASLLPKTLFGEKYVELNVPEQASGQLRAGDVIEKSQSPIEVEKVLADLYPVLRAVQPAELNYTLNALADALDGRGEKLGQTIETLDDYLKRFNPQVPALVEDLRQLSSVSATYADVVPQIAQTLRNTVKTGNTLVDKQAALNTFLKQVSAFSDTSRDFLDTNGANLVELGKLSEPQVALLKRYSPTFPCFLEGMVGQIPRFATTFRGFVFHIQLQLLPKQPRGYHAVDKPVLGADNAPSCAGLPNDVSGQAVPFGSARSKYQIPNFRDGVDDFGGSLGRGDNQRPATGFSRIGVYQGGTPEMAALVTALGAPAMGVPADRVPGVATLLFGPLIAGTEVSVR